MEYLIYWMPVIIPIVYFLVHYFSIISKRLKSIPYTYQIMDEIVVLVDVYDNFKRRWVRESTKAKLLGISPDRKTVIIEYGNGVRYHFVEEIKCYNVLANNSQHQREIDEEIELLKSKKDIWNNL
jgi:hypothetical protein